MSPIALSHELKLRPRRAPSTSSRKKKAHAPTKRRAEPHTPKKSSNSKSQVILSLLRRRSGVLIADLQKETGWQPHSVRGFLSGTVKKKLGLKLRSERTGKGERRYFLGTL